MPENHAYISDTIQNPDQLVVFVHDKTDPRENERHEIALYDEKGNPLWREHPNNPQVDVVVVVPLEFTVSQSCSFDISQIASRRRVKGGEIVKLVGFPNQMRDFDRLPIMRDALISSPYQVSTESSSYFYLDANLHQGMSGSPVIAYKKHIVSNNGEISDILDQFEDENKPDPEIDTYQIISLMKQLGESIQLEDVPGGAILLGIHSGENIMPSNAPIESFRQDDEYDEPLKKQVDELEQRMDALDQSSGLHCVWHSQVLDDIIRNT